MSATHTPNLNLAKPDREDYVSVVADLNDNMDIIDAAFASIQNTLRKVPISIAVGDWTLDDGVYYATFTTAYITDASFEFVFFDRSYKQYAVADVNANKHSGGGGLDFETTTIPTGTITGTAYVFATNDGKLPVIIENTVIDIANGGTGQSSVSGVQSAFGIGDLTQLHTVDKTNLVASINENADNIVTLNGNLTPVSVTPTAASGVTLNDYNIFTIGKIACVNVSIAIGSSDIGSTNNLVTGLPIPKAAFSVAGNRTAGGGNSQAILSTSGVLRNNWDTFASGKTYIFNICYATA